MSDLAEIKAALQERCVEVCRALLPNGRVEGRLYVAHDPVAGDYDKKPALKVRLSGNVGGWAAFRGQARAARHDILGLIEYIRGGDVGDALKWARDFLGWRQMSQAEREKVRRQAARRGVENERREERLKAWKMARARQLFERGTVGIVETRAIKGRAYFEHRQVKLEDVATMATRNFRYCSATEYWPDAVWEETRGRSSGGTPEQGRQANGKRVKRQEGSRWPAIHAAVRGQDGAIVGCHVTFLDDVLPAKAPVEKPKLMFGVIGGGVLEIATGLVVATRGGEARSGEQGMATRVARPFWEEKEAGLLILCEGIETGLSLAVAVPEARVWAALSLNNMGNAPVWLDCVKAVIVARDVNEGNSAAGRQLDSGVERLESWGKPVKVIQSHVGDDFNDLMKGEDNG